VQRLLHLNCGLPWGACLRFKYNTRPEIQGEITPRIKCSRLRFKCNSLLHLNRGLPGSAVYDLSTVRHSYFTSLRTKDGDTILNLEHGNAGIQWGRLIFHVSDVDRFWAYLTEKGFYPDSPHDASWGERYFHMPDPDGAMSFHLLVRSSARGDRNRCGYCHRMTAELSPCTQIVDLGWDEFPISAQPSRKALYLSFIILNCSQIPARIHSLQGFA